MDGTSNIWMIVGLSLGALAVLAAVIVLAVRRMRHDPFEEPPLDDKKNPDDPNVL